MTIKLQRTYRETRYISYTLPTPMIFLVAGLLCLCFVLILLIVWHQFRRPIPTEDAAKPRECHAARVDTLVCATCATCVVLSCVLFTLHFTVSVHEARTDYVWARLVKASNSSNPFTVSASYVRV